MGKIIKMLKRNMIYILPKKLAHSLIYFKTHGYMISWKNPKTYDEKIHWLITNVYDVSYGKYADKYDVRSYVEQCGLSELLVPLLGVYNTVDEIVDEKLPEQFILKTTHGSGERFYDICNDKEKWNSVKVKQKMKKALKFNSAKEGCEYHYRNIKPRIICEKLLTSYVGNVRLTDYKVVCTYGQPKAILVCTNRNDGRDYYSVTWEYLDYVKEEYRSIERADKPKVLDRMLRAAAVLSKGFPLARIDFYIVNNQLFFGEITLTPSAGNHNYLNEMGQKELGSFINI